MTQNLATDSTISAAPDDGRNRCGTLTFERDVAAPLAVLWEAWTAPAARANAKSQSRIGRLSARGSSS